MNTKVLLLSLVAISGAALLFMSQSSAAPKLNTKSALLGQFTAFRSSFGKTYSSKAELEYRFGVYTSNVQLIEAHNADSTSTYSLEVNHHADLTYEEFSAKYLGLGKVDGDVAKCQSTGNDSVSFDDEPEVDWVKTGVVHAVKNQASCGSCWAFASTAALESAHAIFGGKKDLDLSEQELVDCSKPQGNDGCNGGLMHLAFDYILANGINDQAAYPYKGRDQKCKPISGKGANHLKGCRNVEKGVENLIPAARKQPIAVAFYVQDDFQFYHKGVYNPRDCNDEPNHAVTLVGFKLDAPVPYLYIKNSWGVAWGDKGFFKMAVGKDNGTCNIGGHEFNFYPTVN